MTTVDRLGQIVAQNSASFGALGFHGRDHRRLDPKQRRVHYLEELFQNRTVREQAHTQAHTHARVLSHMQNYVSSSWRRAPSCAPKMCSETCTEASSELRIILL